MMLAVHMKWTWSSDGGAVQARFAQGRTRVASTAPGSGCWPRCPDGGRTKRRFGMGSSRYSNGVDLPLMLLHFIQVGVCSDLKRQIDKLDLRVRLRHRLKALRKRHA